MDTVDLERIGRAYHDAQEQARRLELELDDTIVAAYLAKHSVSQIAGVAGVTRGRIYTALKKAGIQIDSRFGRDLVRNRWANRPEPAPAPEPEIARVKGWQTPEEILAGPASGPGIFDEPADGEAEPELSILEFIHRMKNESMARENADL